MASINFILDGMSYFRYFIPLTIEGNKRNINSNYFIYNCGKYNCPGKHQSAISELSKKYNFNTYNINDIKSHSGLTFLMEGVGVEYLNNTHKKISLSYQTDFVDSYKSYKNTVDNIILPSNFMKNYYDLLKDDKVLGIGSPKYGVRLNKKEILSKYNLNSRAKYILVVYPKLRDLEKIDMDLIYNCIRNKGYNIIVKARGKEPARENHKGDYYFQDYSWHPHTTMELTKISDLVINFGSSGIKEFVMLEKPIINFNIKPKEQIKHTVEFLYDYNYCVNHERNFFSRDVDHNNILLDNIDYLTNTDLSNEFKRSIDNHLFESKNGCKNIFNLIESGGYLK